MSRSSLFLALGAMLLGSCKTSLVDHKLTSATAQDLVTSRGDMSTYTLWPQIHETPQHSHVKRQLQVGDKACRNLTVDDVSNNGGLICHWSNGDSQMCSIRCNRGYTVPDLISEHEYCGPSTNFVWTFEERHERIRDCVPEFAPSKLKGEAAYFVKDCNQLSLQAQETAKKQFVKTLTDQGVCKKMIGFNEVIFCKIMNVDITCGQTVRKAGGDVDEVTLSLTLHPVLEGIDPDQFSTADCTRVCNHLKIMITDCQKLCVPAFTSYLQIAARQGEESVREAFQGQHMSFSANSHYFESASEDRHYLDFTSGCLPGSRTNDNKCEPCTPGTFYDVRSNFCVPCKPGTYSDQYRQSQCWPCPTGSTSWSRGATSCTSV